MRRRVGEALNVGHLGYRAVVMTLDEAPCSHIGSGVLCCAAPPGVLGSAAWSWRPFAFAVWRAAVLARHRYERLGAVPEAQRQVGTAGQFRRNRVALLTLSGSA